MLACPEIFVNTVYSAPLLCAALEQAVDNDNETLRELRIGTITERYDIIPWIQKGSTTTVREVALV